MSLWLSSRSAAAQRLRRGFSTTASRGADFTHVVIGGGVVGLAVARALAARPGTSTVLLERHQLVGSETSSRNSEVIHAGIYYGPTSLKTRLCIRGRHLLYSYCASRSVPHSKLGKWIVAADPSQRSALEDVAKLCAHPDVNVPVRWVGRVEATAKEPDIFAGFVSGDEGIDVAGNRAILESPETGIVDSHALMLALQGDFEESGGETVLGARVMDVKPLGTKGSEGWEVVVEGEEGEEASTITADVLVNAAGLGAVDIHNMIAPAADPTERYKMYFAKGNYFSWAPPPSIPNPKVSRLIYPAPTPGFAGLGTHLTLDLAGQIRFGPDVEWVESADDLAVSVNQERMQGAREAVGRYLPAVLQGGEFRADYAGIRPKLGREEGGQKGRGFFDFVVRKEEGWEGWVSLLGIESPGLTSSLAIGEMVDGLLYGSQKVR